MANRNAWRPLAKVARINPQLHFSNKTNDTIEIYIDRERSTYIVIITFLVTLSNVHKPGVPNTLLHVLNSKRWIKNTQAIRIIK